MSACPVCGASLAGRRRHTRFCSGRCRAQASLRRRIESAVRQAGEAPGVGLRVEPSPAGPKALAASGPEDPVTGQTSGNPRRQGERR